jgi:hypothetical protein
MRVAGDINVVVIIEEIVGTYRPIKNHRDNGQTYAQQQREISRRKYAITGLRLV